MSLETINFNHFPINSGHKLLDIGCGEGRHTITAYLKADVTALGLDLDYADLQTARERSQQFSSTPHKSKGEVKGKDINEEKSMHFIQASGLRLPFEDASFDRVICSEVLEHIPDYKQVLSEIQRILKPGGLFAVSVPRYGPEWICWQLSTPYHEVAGGHIRIFKDKKLKLDIAKLNFHIYKRHWAHALHSPFWWLKCLFWSNAESSRLVNAYHKFLIWDLMKKPKITQLAEQCLNPLMGKSVVMYFVKGTT
ncbi:MAG: class I SAM-dependent methyltransferase [Pseudomonadales bacterium]|nr:class I SAM-dependent methyltransferase [Pseudomonadales bacterium]